MLYLLLITPSIAENTLIFLLKQDKSLVNVLADQNLYKLSEIVSHQVNVTLFDPNTGFPELDGFDALLIRSVTKIRKETISLFPPTIKFIGTGSSGSDHVDIDELKNQNIQFADAKGSNANVVAEYVATSLLLLSEKEPKLLYAKIGIIGVGAVGSRVNDLLHRLGFETVLYDPPRQKRDDSFTSASLDEVLRCDVLTFHTPLEQKGDYPTRYWLNAKKLRTRNYLAIINAARGEIIDERAALMAKKEDRIQFLVTDVWENEPDFDEEFAQYCDLATPHIAGSSVQSKLNASIQLNKALCKFFNLTSPPITSSSKSKFEAHSLGSTEAELLAQIHPMLNYDAALRDIFSKQNKAELFARLRTDFPFRNEYPQISIPNLDLIKYPLLAKLGITN